ncbi:glycosyltransferase family 4 protein [Paenibacillus aestuarii]|uniref:Glycosyltransferase family 4 protein n=1 Tax=Paenibacillus aestuarii TaxID=516965 RepID=A0ABW0K0X4_9BACL|nr:glycosyltransferase family 4 protein [Paenibacillus aestuarii]
MNKAILLAPLPPPYGGIATWATKLLSTNLKDDWEIAIVDEKFIDNRSSHSDSNKPNLLNEARRCFKIWKNLMRELKKSNAKVVHACSAATLNGMLRDSISSIITRVFRRKFVIHFHCTVPNEINTFMKLIVFKFLCMNSDAVMVLNEQAKKFVDDNTKTEVFLVPNFVKVDDIINQRSYKEVVRKVIYTGGVTKQKGCDEVIKAAKSFPHVEFELIGSVTKEIESLQIPGNVKLTGVKDKDYIYEKLMEADVFVFFSHMSSEGFSISLLEAMAAGLPCIVSNWAANTEMVESQGGIVVPVHNVEELTRAISKIINDRVKREQMGKWNVDKVTSQYCEQVVTSQYVDVYNRSIVG